MSLSYLPTRGGSTGVMAILFFFWEFIALIPFFYHIVLLIEYIGTRLWPILFFVGNENRLVSPKGKAAKISFPDDLL